jgi:hypothetical protein
MYGAVREYQLRRKTAAETIAKIRDQFAPLIANVPGVVSYTVIVNPAGDRIATISVFETEAGAVESVKRAADWVQTALTASLAEPPRVTAGEITVREVDEDVKAGYAVLLRFSCTTANAVRIAERVRKGLVPMLKATTGFASFGLLVEQSEDRGGASLSTFIDRKTAEGANQKALTWINEQVGVLLAGPPEIFVGEIRLRYARSTVGAA